ncbi:MAG: pyridoxamine 5'-phosphate oxidase [Fermentimonas sp.]|nr:pyridoxamine 5'-phosphate oxidase [Fermentimonas sp.]MDD4697365.1 pyridoxamine 5'-phosphate oxidase [Fermentimonas sp.]
MSNLHQMRQEYAAGSLNEKGMASDPIQEFEEWMDAAISAGLSEPNAMTIASATPDGKPSARVVLLKEFNHEGFVFFTNYNSRKGKELKSNPFAAILFDWHDIERQVRIEGRVEKLSEEDSDEYFNSRPESAKIGAWASPQSRVVKDRDELEKLQEEIEDQFEELPVHRPAHWGGYLVRPTCIEFWQGRPNRMHDRIVYYKTEEGWTMHRLAP